MRIAKDIGEASNTIIQMIDYNYRLPPNMESSIKKTDNKVYRTASALLPLVALIGPVGKVLQVTSGLIEIYHSCTDQQNSTVYKVVIASFHAASLAILIINPMAVSLLQNGLKTCELTYQCSKEISKGNFKAASIHALDAAGKSIYVASILVGGPGIILISMVAQTAMEAVRIYQLQQQGMHLEAVVHTIIASFRGYGIYKHIETNKDCFNELLGKVHNQVIKTFSQYSLQTKRHVDWGPTGRSCEYEGTAWNEVSVDSHNLRFSGWIPNYFGVSSEDFKKDQLQMLGTKREFSRLSPEITEDDLYMINIHFYSNLINAPQTQQEFSSLIGESYTDYQLIDREQLGAKYAVDLIPKGHTDDWDAMRILYVTDHFIYMATNDSNESRRSFFFDGLHVK